MISQQKLVHKRRRAHILSKDPDTPPDELPEFEDSEMDRSYRRHYDVILQICVARRILSSHAISPREIKRGCNSLNRAIQQLARMNAHLTPYYHLATHIEDQFLHSGPSPGFGAYPYERNNGTLGRFNNNGHSGGEMEGTMMRGWWKTTFIQELVCFFCNDFIHLETDTSKAISFRTVNTATDKGGHRFNSIAQVILERRHLRTQGNTATLY